jgi:hypothetical protein
MKKAHIQISQSEAQEIARLLMNYGLVLDVINSARDVPKEIAEFVEKRRTTDFKKANSRFNQLMVKFCIALTNDKDGKPPL